MAGRGSRNILQRVGAAPNLPQLGSKEESDSDNEELESVKTPNNKTMNMKQEGPFLVPQLWKDNLNNLNLDNLTNDFLESNVTGEVMNLDDFLKELQVNELAQQTEELQRQNMAPQSGAMGHNTIQTPPLRMQGNMPQHQGPGPAQVDDSRFSNLIRPTNIENLKDHTSNSMSRPSIMHHVGKPPDLNLKYNSGPGPGHGDGLNMPPISLPYRDRETSQQNLLNSQKEKL